MSLLETFAYMKNRWDDEKGYEDFKDYRTELEKKAQELYPEKQLKLRSFTQRPFSATFEQHAGADKGCFFEMRIARDSVKVFSNKAGSGQFLFEDHRAGNKAASRRHKGTRGVGAKASTLLLCPTQTPCTSKKRRPLCWSSLGWILWHDPNACMIFSHHALLLLL